MYLNTNTCSPEGHRETCKMLRRQYQQLKKKGLLVPDTRCAKCGATQEQSGRKLELHHIVPLRQPMPGLDHNDPSNLHTLCHMCHKAWHKCVEGLLSYNTWMANQSVETDQQMLRRYEVRQYNKRKEAIAKHRTRAV